MASTMARFLVGHVVSDSASCWRASRCSKVEDGKDPRGTGMIMDTMLDFIDVASV
jgi:hypothetical protein